MRGTTVAAVLLGLLAVVSAGDLSEPNHLSGTLSCVLPIAKVRCIRDWRSGFVAGIGYGYDLPHAPTNLYTAVCSTRIGNQTIYDMWNPNNAGMGTNTIAAAQSVPNGAPAWYGRPATADSDYFMPPGALITQVIVLHASNPWGDKFGTIPAVIFVWVDVDGNLQKSTCGNALYAKAYLEPEGDIAAPTPVKLKASYSSGLSEEHDKLTVLGSFDGKCGVRGTSFPAYHGGDPWKSSKYPLKAVTKPCFVPYHLENQQATPTNPGPGPVDVDFVCPENNELCTKTCFYDKKNNKKGPSYSCVGTGTVIATGKYGPIHFDHNGNEYEYAPDAQGKLQKVQAKAGEAAVDGEAMPEEEP